MSTDQIDWSEVWIDQVKKHNEMNGGMDCAAYWNVGEEARNYWRMIEQDGGEFVKVLLDKIRIGSNFRVLDIGAGPGTLAIPFSKMAAHVTAVEPSASMATVLRENLEERGIENVDCIQKRWEEVDVEGDLKPPYDLVVASFSLGMTDIKGAVQKMMAASSGRVYLAWFAGDTSWDVQSREISALLSSEVEYHPMPKSDVLFNLLYQMGVYPNVWVFPLRMHHRFPSFDDALNYFGGQYRVSTDDQRAKLSGYLSRIVEKDGESWAMTYDFLNMMIWWDNNHQET
ncbi:MAG: Methyltransferase [Methanothrix harundinacea]|jgi:FkbM family methyltransferase|uniref:Methyltransferase n=1 Tax=Methanothrix harundinacea TaxID=301375 RepID=A0A101FSG1_9EURY|nr:MAG: Methyltransferase [Methanothrix harundinacea]